MACQVMDASLLEELLSVKDMDEAVVHLNYLYL